MNIAAELKACWLTLFFYSSPVLLITHLKKYVKHCKGSILLTEKTQG